jgi:flagellar M-ring protein FliF
MIARLTAPVSRIAGGAMAGTGTLPAPAPGQTSPASAPGAEAIQNAPAPAQLAAPGASPMQFPKRETIDISQIEGQVRESAIRKIGDVVQAHPEEAMAIVRTWLHQPV